MDTIYYSEVPRRITSDPKEISQMNINKTAILCKVLKKEWSNVPELLLGELQYSFIYFIIG